MSSRRFIVGCFAFLLSLLVVASGGRVTAARAASGHVTTCSSTAPGSLPDVLVGAASGDTIVFDLDCSGVSAITLTPTTGSLEIVDTITIDGTGHAITISGGDTTQIVKVFSGGNATLKALTLTHGGGDDGAAIVNSGGTVTLQNSTISASNTPDFEGGGIFNNGGTLNVQSSLFDGNSANVAGGAISNEHGTVTIQASTFAGNHASQGGAINSSSGSITVQGSTFGANTANAVGGAIYAQASTAVTLSNSTVTGNSAGNNGGGLDLPTASGKLSNVTLSGNTSGGPGSAIAAPLASLTVANTIISGTGGGNCEGSVTDGGNNLQFGDTTCGFSLTANPLLQPLASNGGPTQTMALLTGSPAIGAGSATVCQGAGVSNVDQRGSPRHADTRGNCDIGAYDTGAGAPSAAMTLMRRSLAKIPVGGATSVITVVTRDAAGNRLSVGGATVRLQATLGTLSAVTDNHDGTYTATLTSGNVSGNVKVTGTLNGNPITAAAGVDFKPGPPSGATTLITSSRQQIPADGNSTAVITVVAKDQFGNIVQAGGATVLLHTTSGDVGAVSDIGNGRYRATLTSGTSPLRATISGTINKNSITSTATVKFT